MKDKNNDKLLAESVLTIPKTALVIGSYIHSLSEKAVFWPINGHSLPRITRMAKMAFLRVKGGIIHIFSLCSPTSQRAALFLTLGD